MLLALLSFTSTLRSGPLKQGPSPGKIAPWVLERTAHGAQAEFLVVLAAHAAHA